MTSVNPSDLLLVNRDDQTYKVNQQSIMATLKDTDYLAVNRDDVTYKITGKDFKDSIVPSGEAPVLDNVSLVENTEGFSPRFTDQKFIASSYLSEDGTPQSEKTFDAYVQGTILTDISTDIITEVEELDGAWTSGAPTGLTGGLLSGVAFGAGKYISGNVYGVSGGTSVFATSTDGLNWTETPANGGNAVYFIGYGGGKFVAQGGSDGTNDSQYSTDGINWTKSTRGSNVYGGVYSDTLGRWVTVGSNIKYSDDGIIWSLTTGVQSASWQDAAYGKNKFVAVGASGNSGRISYSTDGESWQTASVPTNEWKGVAFGNGKFVAVGSTNAKRVMYSDDGVSWTSITAANEAATWTSVAFGNGRFTAVADSGTDRLMTSTDGINWEVGTIPDATWTTVYYGNNKFIAVSYGGAGQSAVSTTGTGVTATQLTLDGTTNLEHFTAGSAVVQNSAGTPVTSIINTADQLNGTWTAFNEPQIGYAIAYGNGKWVSPLAGYSADGKVWEPSGNTIQFFPETDVLDAAYGNDVYVGVRPGPQAAGTDPTINANVVYSSDGITWTQTPNAASGSNSYVTFGNGIFVACGVGVSYSTDGIEWTQSSDPKTIGAGVGFAGIAYGNGKFLAIASSGLLSSTDGETWTTVTLPSDVLMSGLTYGTDDTWVGVGSGYASYSLDNGVTWVATGLPTSNVESNGGWWISVTYGNGVYVAVAYVGNNSTYKTMQSLDGINWTAVTSGDNSKGWQKVKFGGGLFLSTIYSGNVGQWTNLATGNGGYELSFANTTNLANLASGDLVTETGGDASGTILSLIGTSAVISPSSGTWSPGSTLTGPYTPAASGTVGSISGSTMNLSSSNGRWLVTEAGYETDKKLNKTVEITVVLDNAKKYLDFDSSGNVLSLLDSPQDPPYTTTDLNPGLTFTFPSTFPSGNAPDVELGDGTTLTVEVTASNDSGTSGPLTDTVQPATDGVLQFNEPLESIGVGLRYSDTLTTSVGPSGFVTPASRAFDGDVWSRASIRPIGTDLTWTFGSYGLTGDLDLITYTVGVAPTFEMGKNGVFTPVTPIYSPPAEANAPDRIFKIVDDIENYDAIKIKRPTKGIELYQVIVDGVVLIDAPTPLTFATGTDMSTLEAGDTVNQKSNGDLEAIGGVFGPSNGPDKLFDGSLETDCYVSTNDSTCVWNINTSQLDLRGKSLTYYTKAGSINIEVTDEDDTVVVTRSDYIDGQSLAGRALPIDIPNGKPITKIKWDHKDPRFGPLFAQMSAFAVDGNVLSDAYGTVGSITDTTVTLASGNGIWVTEANGGLNVIGPDKTTIRSLTEEELEAQKLKFLTYDNRTDTKAGEDAAAQRSALESQLLSQGYTQSDIDTMLA